MRNETENNEPTEVADLDSQAMSAWWSLEFAKDALEQAQDALLKGQNSPQK